MNVQKNASKYRIVTINKKKQYLETPSNKLLSGKELVKNVSMNEKVKLWKSKAWQRNSRRIKQMQNIFSAKKLVTVLQLWESKQNNNNECGKKMTLTSLNLECSKKNFGY